MAMGKSRENPLENGDLTKNNGRFDGIYIQLSKALNHDLSTTISQFRIATAVIALFTLIPGSENII
jgi:hypothetical protein